MSVYIIRKPELLQKVIQETISTIWSNTTIADLTDVGHQKRICFTVEGQPAMLDIYQNKDGTTTFRAVGKNIELTNHLITELEKRSYPATTDVKSFSMYVGTEWIQKSVDYLIRLTTAENYGFYESKANNGNTIHSYTSAVGDKLTLTECAGGRLLVQGKPLYLYNELISFVSYSPNVNIDEIVAATKAFVTNKVVDAASAISFRSWAFRCCVLTASARSSPPLTRSWPGFPERRFRRVSARRSRSCSWRSCRNTSGISTTWEKRWSPSTRLCWRCLRCWMRREATSNEVHSSYIMLPFFWIPEDTIPIRVRRASVPYDVWRQQGYLNATEGNVIHYGFIEKFIEELGKVYHIKEIAFDRWGATQMVQDLEGMGFTVVPFGQGFKDMSPPTKEFYKLLMEGRIIHGGNPVMRWMAGNVVVDRDPAENIKPTKAKSPEKIDGIVAAIMALDRCIRHDGDTGSVYDDPDHGLLIF